MESKSTKHGKQRGKERLGIRKGSMDRQSQLAIERGLPFERTNGGLHRWIDKQRYLFNERRQDVSYIVFNNKLFVYNGDRTLLITILNLPTNLQQNAASQVKKYRELVNK